MISFTIFAELPSPYIVILSMLVKGSATFLAISGSTLKYISRIAASFIFSIAIAFFSIPSASARALALIPSASASIKALTPMASSSLAILSASAFAFNASAFAISSNLSASAFFCLSNSSASACCCLANLSASAFFLISASRVLSLI